MTAPENGKTPNGNGLKLDLKNLNLPTLLLVLLTGGGNLFLTQNNSNQRQYQIDRALDQIRELHSTLDRTDERQRFAIDNFTKLLEGQNRIMAAQSKILENDTITLRQVHDLLEKLEEIRRVERMPGAHP